MPLITPQTKVGDLLKWYPELEQILIEIAPAFKKLQNPVLRKTVARVTSLAQAARVGGVPVSVLVTRLRAEVGQPEFSESTEPLSDSVSSDIPEWFDKERVVSTLDARPMIDAGEQPVGVVLRELGALNEGHIYELVTPFEPAPLIDRARERGFKAWSRSLQPGEYRTYFVRLSKGDE